MLDAAGGVVAVLGARGRGVTFGGAVIPVVMMLGPLSAILIVVLVLTLAAVCVGFPALTMPGPCFISHYAAVSAELDSNAISRCVYASNCEAVKTVLRG